MANKNFNSMQGKPNIGLSKPMKAPGFPEKPGFNTGVPGKTQPRDRSAGVKRAPIHPKSEGL